MQINHIDHLVLTVKDPDATIAFYRDVMGMRADTFQEGRQALFFGNQKINLHQLGHEIEPKAHSATPGSADLCFISSTPISEIEIELKQKNIAVISSNVTRTGACGKIKSIYFRDPDLNLIEVSNYL
ncbi:VOC family protein [Pedobacter westerhofensis]|nr:VOC family protein [Pedobacter westerhofensis]